MRERTTTEEVPLVGTPLTTCMADVQPRPVNWLWQHRLAKGKINMVIGDPEAGKTLLTMDTAARVTMGRAWPDNPLDESPCGNVIIVSCEDDPADTLRPRLDACGADVKCIHILDGINWYDEELNQNTIQQFTLEHLPALESAMDKVGNVQLVIFDPIGAYLGGRNSHKDAEVRALLGPLASMAARREVCVLCVAHMNKSGGNNAMYRGMGSLAFVAASRTAWLLCKDKEDTRRRLFLRVKNNLAPDDVEGLSFRITVEDGQTAPCIYWESEKVTMTANEALTVTDPEESDSGEAVEWLREKLCGGESFAAKAVQEMAKRDGISVRNLNKAKTKLGVIAKPETAGGQWVWRLPRKTGD